MLLPLLLLLPSLLVNPLLIVLGRRRRLGDGSAADPPCVESPAAFILVNDVPKLEAPAKFL